MSRLVFLDTETTSLDDTRGEVWEIGAIVRDTDGDTEHLWQIRPDLTTADPNSLRIGRFYDRCHLIQGIDAGALRIPTDGSDPDELIDLRTPERVAADLAAFLDGAHVVGAVPDFDYRFLRRFLSKHGQCWTAHYHLIDVEVLAVGFLYGKAVRLSVTDPGPDWSSMAAELAELPWKSTALYRAVGVDSRQFEEHTALGDARLVRAVYDAVTGGGSDA